MISVHIIYNTASRIDTGTPDYYNSENAQGPHII